MDNDRRRARLKSLRQLHSASEQMLILLEGIDEGVKMLPLAHKDYKAYRIAVRKWKEIAPEMREAWFDAHENIVLAKNKLAEITDDTKPKELE